MGTEGFGDHKGHQTDTDEDGEAGRVDGVDGALVEEMAETEHGVDREEGLDASRP